MQKQDANYFSRVRTIHFVGIKGIAMAALAVWAKERGIAVSGSDVEELFPSDEVLLRAGIAVQHGFRADHVTKSCDVVIYTGAHGGRDNIEVKTAEALGVPVLAHGKALGFAMNGKEQISVAGSHGKTTTAAMIATILHHAKKDPSYAVGCGAINGLGLPGHSGHGVHFVAEADEYVTDPSHDKTPRFLWQSPTVLVVTNIDYDHPDAYASLADIQLAFAALVNKQPSAGFTVVNADDPASVPLLRNTGGARIVTFGRSKEADYQVKNIAFGRGVTSFDLTHHNTVLGHITLHVPGIHNALNGGAAAVACLVSGVSIEEVEAGLRVFGGAKRRFERIGESRGAICYDDYAHHPREIQATLAAARSWYPNDRLIAVFQPHTYSRTKALLADFSKAFSVADRVIITDIYASARETSTLGIDGSVLADETRKYHKDVTYAALPEDVSSHLSKTITPGDVLIFMGAGDIYSWEKRVVEAVA